MHTMGGIQLMIKYISKCSTFFGSDATYVSAQ